LFLMVFAGRRCGVVRVGPGRLGHA
jgi:hypothetical protein